MTWIRDRQKNNDRLVTTNPAAGKNGAEAAETDSGNGHASNQPENDSSQPADVAAVEDWFLALKRELHQQVIKTMDLSVVGALGKEELRLEVRRQVEILCRNRADLLSSAERERLVNEVLHETFGLGPLESLMLDPDVSDILINGPKSVYVERKGRLEKTAIAFHDEHHLLQVVQRVAGRGGSAGASTKPAPWSTLDCSTAAA